MSEIAWSKAPEGCTHYVVGSTAPYEKRVGDNWWYWSVGREAWIAMSNIGDQRLVEGLLAIIPRPSPAWNGEGKPPVGTVCQWFSPIYGWLGGKVVGHDGTLTVIAHNDGYTGCHPHEVRPIRTPEQIAADEREAAIAEMVKLVADGQDYSVQFETLTPTAEYVKDACIKLYQAGYRKN